MIYPGKPFYVISGFERASPEIKMGAFGFGVGLDMDFAKKAYEMELTEEAYKTFIERGKEMIKSVGSAKNDLMIYPPYTFVPNKSGKLTKLLQYIQVPGDATQLGIVWRQVEDIQKGDPRGELLEYGPHNVDSVHQAYEELSLWLKWADHIYACSQE